MPRTDSNTTSHFDLEKEKLKRFKKLKKKLKKIEELEEKLKGIKGPKRIEELKKIKELKEELKGELKEQGISIPESNFNLDDEKEKLKEKLNGIEELKEQEISLLENDFFTKISPRNPLLTKDQVRDIKNKYIEEYKKSIDLCIEAMKKEGNRIVNTVLFIFYPEKRGIYENVKNFIEDNLLLRFNSSLGKLKGIFSGKLNKIENDLLTVNKRSEYLRSKIIDMQYASTRLQLKMRNSLLQGMTAEEIEALKNNIMVEYNRKFYHIKIFLRDDFMKVSEESLSQFPSFKLIKGMPVNLLESNLDRHFIFLNEYLEIARALEMIKEAFFQEIRKLTHSLDKNEQNKNKEEKSKKIDYLKHHYKKACVLNYQKKEQAKALRLKK